MCTLTWCTALLTPRFPLMVPDESSEMDTLLEYRERVKPLVTDTVLFMSKAIKEGKKIIIEGANAAMLDIDFGNSNQLALANSAVDICKGYIYTVCVCYSYVRALCAHNSG